MTPTMKAIFCHTGLEGKIAETLRNSETILRVDPKSTTPPPDDCVFAYNVSEDRETMTIGCLTYRMHYSGHNVHIDHPWGAGVYEILVESDEPDRSELCGERRRLPVGYGEWFDFIWSCKKDAKIITHGKIYVDRQDREIDRRSHKDAEQWQALTEAQQKADAEQNEGV